MNKLTNLDRSASTREPTQLFRTMERGSALFSRYSQGAVLADANQRVNSRAEARLLRASRQAQVIEILGQAFSMFMKHENERAVANLPGARAARESKNFRMLVAATEKFATYYRTFSNEHGALLDDDCRASIETFLTWVPHRAGEFRARVKEFRAEYEKDLAEDREHLAKVASAWSVVDGDGLTSQR